MRLFIIMFGLQLELAAALLQLIAGLDPEQGLRMNREAGGILLAGSLAGAGMTAWLYSHEHPVIWGIYLILAVYMTVCVITDRQSCMVYDFLQPPAAAAGAVLCLLRPLSVSGGVALVCFALLQYFLFMRLYGKGDGMAFQICSLYIVGAGGSLETLLLHMAAAFSIMGMVQLARGNINRKGNLKAPVPFLPYIACSLLWFL